MSLPVSEVSQPVATKAELQGGRSNPFLLMPITCVYYPVATLPWVLQPIAWALPTTYVFEGMRSVIIHHTFRFDLMAIAFVMNAVWFSLAVFAFYRLLAAARRSGSLLQQGE